MKPIFDEWCGGAAMKYMLQSCEIVILALISVAFFDFTHILKIHIFLLNRDRNLFLGANDSERS